MTEPRFLCDAMLAHLARWLRAAGYDTLLADPSASDAELLGRAAGEDRWLLTCDRDLGKAHPKALWLPMVELDRLAEELRERLGVDWNRAPFRRCLVDNAPLTEVEDPEAVGIPAPACRLPGPFTRCPECGRAYWPGSHVRRMRERLRRWSGRTKPPVPAGWEQARPSAGS